MLSPKTKVAVGLGFAALAVLSLIALTPVAPKVVLAVGVPDAYGNRILRVAILQYQGGKWYQKGFVTNLTYDAHDEINIDPCNNTRIYVKTWIKNSFAGSTAAAQTYSNAYVAITGEVTSTLCTKVNSTLNWGGYSVWHYYQWNPDSESAGKPYAGLTYYVTVVFNAYFDPADA